MGKIKSILFDLDGTLLPMDQKLFIKLYFKELLREIAALGKDVSHLQESFFAGIQAIAQNDGKATNEEVFWQCFSAVAGWDAQPVKDICDQFYGGSFHNAQASTWVQPLAQEAVKIARDKGMGVVLATSPMFPRCGVEARLRWAGLEAKSFDYITTYEWERHAKPQPEYFTDLLRKLHLQADECLMVGNDELEDMYAATQAGLHCYLVTDCLISSQQHPFTGNRGSFQELIAFLKRL